MTNLAIPRPNTPIFDKHSLSWIKQQNLWNLWVPKTFGGLEASFEQGLQQLQSLARIDGSLGWTVTLCAGANFFVGNLQPETAKHIFAGGHAILGGSGGIFGTAEKIGNHYMLNGTWRYATGAPYLTHFTLNAQIVAGGKPLTHEDESPQFLSFVIPADKVRVIEDWNTMGLKASATHSFEVTNLLVNPDTSFSYNQCYLPQTIFNIPFSLFADLTLWVNYVGMAEHFIAEAGEILKTDVANTLFQQLQSAVEQTNTHITQFAQQTSRNAAKRNAFDDEFIGKVHQIACASIRTLTQRLVSLYPYLGINAAREGHILNQIFRDYFTATQHHIFTMQTDR